MTRVEVVRAVGGEVVSIGPEMVVHDVEDHRDAVGVCLIHEVPQVIGSAIAALRCVDEDAIVTPIARAGKIGDRHDFNRIHPKAWRCGSRDAALRKVPSGVNVPT